MNKKLIGILVCILFFGASIVSGFADYDTNVTKSDYIQNENEGYIETQPTFFNGGNSNGWSITEVVSTESTDGSRHPSLMVDSDGVVHVAWYDYTDYGGSGSDLDIFYKYKTGGGSWSTAEVVSTESTDHSMSPSLSVDSEDLKRVV